MIKALARVLCSLALIGLSALLLYSAYLSWDEDRIVEQVRSGTHPLVTEYDVSSVPDGYVKPLKSALVKAYNKPAFRDDKINPIIDKYIAVKPGDFVGLMKATEIAQFQGDKELAFARLKIAHQASIRRTSGLKDVFSSALTLGEIEFAEQIFKEIVTHDPRYFYEYFSYLSRLDNDYDRLLRNSIPEKLSTFRDFEDDYYYVAAMKVALRKNNIKLANLIWEKMPKEYRVQSSVGLSYMRYVRKQGDTKRYSSIWNDFIEGGVNTSNFPNPAFEEASADIQPCFADGSAKGVKWAVIKNSSLNEDFGKNVLRVLFDGSSNVNLYQVECSLALSPGVSYEFSGDWQSNDISTLSGVYFEVLTFDRDIKRNRTGQLLGTKSWDRFSLKFTVPSETGLTTFRLRRNKTNKLDKKISGKVLIDNLKLTRY